ncbi:MAG: CDP-diacylglycerol--glycerol-3-phosphate 3-phosphatidyltransferase [Opitutales bacterium]
MNVPTLLTFSRIPILFGIVALLYAPFTGASAAAFIVFLAGALTDWADGYYARKQGLVSNFGKLMDALTDKVFMLGIFITFLAMGVLPGVWGLLCILLILSREFLITGLRLVAASSGVVLAAEKSGKQKTVSQIVAAGLLLASISVAKDFSGRMPDLIGDLLRWGGLACFVLATVLTVSSGTVYLVKHWAVFTGGSEGEDA